MTPGWVNDPGHLFLRRAGRAALIVPSTFALVSFVTDESQAALFAAFGAFALLTFADFGGPPIPRTSAYLLTTVVGAAVIVVGTALSGSLVAATAGTLLVVSAIRFAGGLGGYSEAAGATLILTFVLAVAIKAPFDDVVWRLVGWFAAGAAATPAALLLWPHRGHGVLLEKAARACRDLGRSVRTGSGRGELVSVAELEREYAGLPYRPAGPWKRYRALRRLVDELVRARRYVPAAPSSEHGDSELRLKTGDLLDSTAGRLESAATAPNLLELEAARRNHREAGIEEAHRALASGAAPEEVLDQIDARFRLRLVSYTALSIAANATLTTGGQIPPPREFEVPPETARPEGAGGALQGVGALLRAQLTSRSARAHDAARVGAGLAAAVLVAEIADVSHAFWVVLATLLILRTDALATGRAAWLAILGTSAGFLLASLLMIAIGDTTALLWIAMPIAAFLAAYTPGAVRFIVGQGAFTLFVVVLFNLIEPEGWLVALVRLEDVAIGAGVSLVIGFALWPRGAGVVLRQSLAEAIQSGSRYMCDAVAVVLGQRDDSLAKERDDVVGATTRSSEALSQHLGEPGVHLPDRTWDSLLAVPRQLRGAGDLLLAIARAYGTGGGGPALTQRAEAVAARYSELSLALGGDRGSRASATEAVGTDRGAAAITEGPAQSEPGGADLARAEVIAALRSATADGGRRDLAARLALTHEWLAFLSELADSSAAPVAEAAASAARPWWR